MATFNSPPGWPTPPAGWSPPAGWQPEPDWPPAPAGWNYWVEQPQPTAEAPADPYAWALAPASTVAAQAATAPVAPAPPVPAPQLVGTLPLPSGPVVPTQHAPGPPAGAPTTAGHAVGPAVGGAYAGTPYAGGPSPYATSGGGLAAVADQLRSAAKRQILLGSLWLVGGLVVTALVYAGTAPGGRFPIFWGAVLFGAIQAVRGLVQHGRAESQALAQLSGGRL